MEVYVPSYYLFAHTANERKMIMHSSTEGVGIILKTLQVNNTLHETYPHTVSSQSFKLAIVNPRRACAVRVTVVGLCVRVCVCMCVSVTQHLTSQTFVRLALGTTYSTGSKGQKVCVVFSENAPLQS